MNASTITAELVSTKWGYAIEFQGRLAFLSYGGKSTDFEAGKRYVCRIFWQIMYAATPEGANKNWSSIESDSLEGLRANPAFQKHALNIFDAHPYFTIESNRVG